MNKKLFLMTALFAGTMVISNEVCAGNGLNQNDNQENQDHHEQIDVNAQEQGNENAAWGDAEKKEMANQCITEISK